jgi:hypothetical protein
LPRDERVELSITGKGGKVRQVLLPAIVSRVLLSLRGDAGANDPVFASRKVNAGPACPKFGRRLDTATSRRRAICMHAPIAQVGCALIPECFFDVTSPSNA